ncbi:hypothetical protein HXZ66_18300 [Bacillus sp. A116_S68]|nr:hypothetical protein HXZ66_18300 [Bacillus sp. A116_S68]
MPPKVGVDVKYWNRRVDMMYYKYIDFLVRAFAYNATTLIDVGSANTQYIENFNWIPKKYTLDIKNPYQSPNVVSIETNFLTYEPKEKFDFATCFQVLEHIPQAKEFAQKLLTISDEVLISVPYLWPEDAEDEHVHDPVDLDKVIEWFGKEPAYSIIVSEPLRNPKKPISQRLICYYTNHTEKLDYKKLLLQARELSSNDVEEDLKVDLVNMKEEMMRNFHKQTEIFNKLNIEMKINMLENSLKDKTNSINILSKDIASRKKEIKMVNKNISKMKEDQSYYQKLSRRILNSGTWKLSSPIRKLGDKLKGK